jgi:hypothetical protein
MINSTTHYQTSFQVADPTGETLMRLKASVYGWIVTKEKDRRITTEKAGFFTRCDWRSLYGTHSSIATSSFYSEDGGDGWAIHYAEIDKDCGRKRFWYSDIGLKKNGDSVVVSVRISFAWNEEDLSHVQEAPSTTVPKVVRFIIQDNHVYSGRPEYRLVEKPIMFGKPGMGKALVDFIQAPDRRYPLIVFNGDGIEHVKEAAKLARELTGKALVAVVASNVELADEIKEFLPMDYRIPFGQFRIFFPFNNPRNTPQRHRWYDVDSADYTQQRQGIVYGLLRSHTLLEKGAVETVDGISGLVNRSKLSKLEAASPELQKQLNDFLEEHSKVATERDQAKAEASFFANEFDRLEEEVKKLEWRCKESQGRLDALGQNGNTVDTSQLLPSLPTSLMQVAEVAGRFFNRLVITKEALESAEDYAKCQSINEAWEMLHHLNTTLWHLKFEDDSPKDLEKSFTEKTGYELAMSEGRKTKRDGKLMSLRILCVDGREYDITPHLKHQNNEPKSVRIYFAFDEEAKKIIVGHIGRHIPNATSKSM